MSGLGIIAQEADRACEMCNTVDECRPYGPKYEQICFNCAMKNPELTEKRMGEYIFGDQPEPLQ